MKRFAAVPFVLALLIAALATTVTPAAAGLGEPPERFNDGFTSIPIRANGSYVPVVGDFSCDGVDDILWYGPGSAPDYLWTVTSVVPFTYTSKPLSINGTYRPQIFFSGDCTSILWYAPGAAQDYIWHPTGSIPIDGAVPAGVPSEFASVPTTVGGDYKTTLVVSGTAAGPGFPSIFLYGAGTAPEAILDPTEGGNLAFSEIGDIVGGDFESIEGASLNGVLDSVVFLDDQGTDQILESFFEGSPLGAETALVEAPTLRDLTVQRSAGQRLIGPIIYSAFLGANINYGPGAGEDDLIRYEPGTDSVLAGGSIRGTYVTGSGLTSVVYHRPGPGQDYLWFSDEGFVGGAGDAGVPAWLD